MKDELTRQDEMSLAGAALRGAPWKAATVAGGAVAATSFGLSVISGRADLDLGDDGRHRPLRSHRGHRLGQQARRRGPGDPAGPALGAAPPWKFSLYPALGAAALMYPVQLIVDGEGMFGAALDALQGGVLVYLITAIVALAFRGRGRSSLPPAAERRRDPRVSVSIAALGGLGVFALAAALPRSTPNAARTPSGKGPRALPAESSTTSRTRPGRRRTRCPPGRA